MTSLTRVVQSQEILLTIWEAQKEQTKSKEKAKFS